MEKTIAFQLNNKPVTVTTDPTRRLLDVLREDFGLTGTKEGCGEGECGACSILYKGHLANSCLLPIGAVEGEDVLTIEGYAETERFAVMEQAFADAGAVQCGFCTPGMLMAGEALLRQNTQPTDMEIREALSGNLCRCTGYSMIVEAIQLAVERGRELWQN